MPEAVEQQLTTLETFFNELRGIKDMVLNERPVEPQSPADIAEVEKALGYPLPGDVATLWRRGFACMKGYLENPHVSVGWDFTDCASVLEGISDLRGIAGDAEGDEEGANGEFYRLAREGFPITFENPVLATDASGAIYYLNFKDCDAYELAPSLAGFLATWLKAGTFRNVDSVAAYGAFLEAIKPALPAGFEPSPENTWWETYRTKYEPS